MTHIDNIAHITQHGITHINSPNANQNYVPIGDGSLIDARNNREMRNGKKLGDFIPFYFSYRMPMLYVIQRGLNGVKIRPPEEIVYCVSSIADIQREKLNFFYTDGHAINYLTAVYNQKHIGKIESVVDFEATKAKFWKDENDLDLKRRKEAEFLVEGDIPYNAFRGFAVYNEEAKSKLQALGVTKKIVVRPKWYF